MRYPTGIPLIHLVLIIFIAFLLGDLYGTAGSALQNSPLPPQHLSSVAAKKAG